MRRIFVLTGKRGGYGAMKPMLQILRDDSEVELHARHRGHFIFGSTHICIQIQVVRSDRIGSFEGFCK